jgi:hypothetical protein
MTFVGEEREKEDRLKRKCKVCALVDGVWIGEYIY